MSGVFRTGGATVAVRALGVGVIAHMRDNPGRITSWTLADKLGVPRTGVRRTLEWLKGRGEIKVVGVGPGSGYELTEEGETD